MNEFKDILKDLRLSRKMTQEDLAAKLSVSKSTISMYENGNREPDFETLETIADFFNVDMNYLLGGKPNNYNDELQIYFHEIQFRPELMDLLRVAIKASDEEIEKAIKILEMFRS